MKLTMYTQNCYIDIINRKQMCEIIKVSGSLIMTNTEIHKNDNDNFVN